MLLLLAPFHVQGLVIDGILVVALNPRPGGSVGGSVQPASPRSRSPGRRRRQRRSKGGADDTPKHSASYEKATASDLQDQAADRCDRLITQPVAWASPPPTAQQMWSHWWPDHFNMFYSLNSKGGHAVSVCNRTK